MSEVRMINKLILTLENDEFAALFKAASRELRNPDKQAHFMIRQELERRGLLRATQAAEDPKQSDGGNHATD
jgi:hypothetical protein